MQKQKSYYAKKWRVGKKSEKKKSAKKWESALGVRKAYVNIAAAHSKDCSQKNVLFAEDRKTIVLA